MIENIEKLISALREEMQQYGEMLALLDQQQEQVKARSAQEVFRSVSFIQAQAAVLQTVRAHREQCRQSVLKDAARTEAVSFTELIPLLPADYRPLVKALVDENNHLLARVRQRAHQNHLLLRRSVELMERLMASLFSSLQTSVYNGAGGIDKHYLETPSLYSSVG
jgi:flagellar biosynthesis/type III secretory pathway chaperone